jgi:cytolysin-activating lysine-acyltransferase
MTTPSFHIVAPAFNLPAQSDAESFGSVVWLWMHASRHNHHPLFALEHTLLPAIHLGQYVLVIEINTQSGARRPVGYLGWANLSAEAEARYIQNPITGLNRDDWNSGDRMWFTDYVAPFGNTTKVHALWKPLFAQASSRYMYHRSNERGVHIRQFVGARVTPDDARQWWTDRPMLAAPAVPAAQPTR